MFKKLKIHRPLFLIFVISLLHLFTGCSPESGNPLAKNYHNTTARYNAYFIAKERMKEVEGIIWKNNVDDFNKILKVFPHLRLEDTALIKAPAEECIKKASIAIQRHKNSKWTDKSFNLIGLTRLYLKDYANAKETFKYVNTKGKDKNAKHAALINLMRLLIETKEYDNAVSVASYLRKESLNKANTRDLNLVKAYYFGEHQDLAKKEIYIGFAIPDVNDLNARSRLYFIIGQIRQRNGDNKGASVSYKAALKNNPNYEIAFYSRLNLAQVSEIDSKGDLRKIQKNFAKLLKDIRNEDFKDKIYYEMAIFELKRKDTQKAIAYLEKSVSASTISTKQKALSYLKLGELYYEEQKNYELAKAYYDSTVTLLPKDAEYNNVFRRQRSLENFVTQINTISMEDSLQRFSKMDSVTLNQYIARIEEEQSVLAQHREESKASEATFSSVFDELGDNDMNNRSTQGQEESGGWYFYSPAALSRGKSQFTRVWGNRPLEDNWRRSTKDSENNDNTDANLAKAEKNETQDTSGVTTETRLVGAFDKNDFLSRIPKTEEEIQNSNQRIEDAYFALGKIYDQELDESSNSIKTFETLLKRFPSSSHKPEVYYYLYLLNNKIKGPDADAYKNKLAAEFPNSQYNKLANNPNYLSDSKKEEKLLLEFYQEAYSLYKIERLDEAVNKIDSIAVVYPENSISDRFSLLKILIEGKRQKLESYQQSLNQFISEYPDSKLVPYAQELLNISQQKGAPAPDKMGKLYQPNAEN